LVSSTCIAALLLLQLVLQLVLRQTLITLKILEIEGYKGRGNGSRVARVGAIGKSEHAWRRNSQECDWLWIGKSAGQNGESPICPICDCDL
jgi:hypothetical protein